MQMPNADHLSAHLFFEAMRAPVPAIVQRGVHGGGSA